MALLTRRALQDLINDGMLPPNQLSSLLARLNRAGEDSLNAEWEAILLSALGRVGIVEHEPSFAGTAKLDFAFTHESGLGIVGDITCISDDEVNRRNPAPQLSDEIWRRLRERHLEGGFTLGIGADTSGGRGRIKSEVVLALPAPHEFTRYIFTADFESFLDNLHGTAVALTYAVNNTNARLSITYTPHQHQITMSYLDHRSPRDVTRNPLYNRLKRKVEQLKRAELPRNSDVRGVLVCDADSSLFGYPVGTGVFSFDQIARHFLRRTHTLDFVAAISVAQRTHWANDATGGYGFTVRVIDGPGRGIAHTIQRILTDGLAQLPRPVRTPGNARNHLNWQERAGITALSIASRAEWQWSHGRLKMSARAAIDYLLGRIDRSYFERLVDPWSLSLLKKTLDDGGLVHAVRLDRAPEKDDDQLILEWSEYDAAVAPFQSNQTK